MRLRVSQISLCVAILATIGLIAWSTQPDRLLRSASSEIDQLYGTYRPFPYRWDGAHYGVIHGGASKGCIPLPEEKLAKARLQVARAERMAGQSARSLQLVGRIDLLLCKPSDAIPKYKLALLLEPTNSSLQLELGVAFALVADGDSQLDHEGALAYEAALQAMLQASRDFHGPEFLFNSALLFGEAQLPNQAMEQWTKVIQAEPSPEWREDEVARLAERQGFMRRRQQRMSALTASPASFVADRDDAHAGAELALGVATEEWLPQMYRSRVTRVTRQDLNDLASILLQDHHDRWLLDILKTKRSPQPERAFSDLSEAIRLNTKGEHSHAAEHARAAEKFFRQTNNAAGILRSRIEIVYSLDRRSQAAECKAAL